MIMEIHIHHSQSPPAIRPTPGITLAPSKAEVGYGLLPTRASRRFGTDAAEGPFRSSPIWKHAAFPEGRPIRDDLHAPTLTRTTEPRSSWPRLSGSVKSRNRRDSHSLRQLQDVRPGRADRGTNDEISPEGLKSIPGDHSILRVRAFLRFDP